jgi:hypothetical protein
MLKSSSLCLYSSNFGTFWLKIEQFWPFEEIFFVMAAILDTGSIMMNFLTYITGFFMNFELLPILTNYEI